MSRTSTDTQVAVIGGGITGLATAWWLEHDHGIHDVTVLEGGERTGGKIQSWVSQGHLLEWGPQGFLDNAPDTLELAALAGLADEVVRADEASADRFIMRSGVLHSVPTSPPAFLFSDLLPLRGRLRVMLEAFAGRHPGADETVFDFARRRIGKHAAAVLVDAMVTGVFAGDSTQLSLAATFPRMAAMEKEYGSLTRALIAKMREARKKGANSSGPAGPGGTLCTFQRGMQQLPDALVRGLGERLRLNTPVTRLTSDGSRVTVTGDGFSLSAERVLAATPARTTSRLVAELAPAAVPALDAIPTVPIAVLMASYTDPGAFGRPLHGFGFLVPRAEQLGILGTLYCHAIFPGQAPPGRLFLRTMVGGAREPEAAGLDDSALMARVRSALARVFGNDPEPDAHWLVRWESGISQYTVGHLDRVRTVEDTLRPFGIEVAGSPYRGVSVNDCIKQARAAAKRIAEQLG